MIEDRVNSPDRRKLLLKSFDRSRILLHGSQNIQALEIAGALPERIQWSISIQSRKRRLFHVAVSAQTLQSFGNNRRRSLGDPILGNGGSNASELLLARVFA